MFPLLSNASATGTPVLIAQGEYAFAAWGTFGGATVTLQRLMSDKTTWMAVGTDATLTATGQCICELPNGIYRAAVSGGAPSALFANLEPTGA